MANGRPMHPPGTAGRGRTSSGMGPSQDAPGPQKVAPFGSAKPKAPAGNAGLASKEVAASADAVAAAEPARASGPASTGKDAILDGTCRLSCMTLGHAWRIEDCQARLLTELADTRYQDQKLAILPGGGGSRTGPDLTCMHAAATMRWCTAAYIMYLLASLIQTFSHV